jgi:hypothetical protein
MRILACLAARALPLYFSCIILSGTLEFTTQNLQALTSPLPGTDLFTYNTFKHCHVLLPYCDENINVSSSYLDIIPMLFSFVLSCARFQQSLLHHEKILNQNTGLLNPVYSRVEHGNSGYTSI